MSDERDEVGTDDGNSGVNGGDTTGAERPSGKRRARGGATTGVAATERAEAGKQARASSRNPFSLVFRFIGEVVSEMRKVIWPTRPQMVTYTIVVLVFLVFMTALVTGVDVGAGKLVELVLEP